MTSQMGEDPTSTREDHGQLPELTAGTHLLKAQRLRQYRSHATA